jgi:hypothetical protein
MDGVACLADILMQRKFYTKAEMLARKALEEKVKVYGRDHHQVIKSMLQLASIAVSQVGIPSRCVRVPWTCWDAIQLSGEAVNGSCQISSQCQIRKTPNVCVTHPPASASWLLLLQISA